jgi:hypothetical protein
VGEEVVVVPAGTAQSGPTALHHRAATITQPPTRLGLVLAVIATAQLMVSLDLTIVDETG